MLDARHLESPLTEADIARLPAMTKSDLMDNFDEIVTDPRVTLGVCEAVFDGRRAGDYLFDEYRVIASGGSSGRRGVFVYGWDAWATCYASIVRFQQRDGNSDPRLAGVAIATIAQEADAGRLRIAPRRVVAISEPLLPEARAVI